MEEIVVVEPTPVDFEMPPTEDELPCDDGMPMETDRHVNQMLLLKETLSAYWDGKRDDFYVAGNMFVYFSPEQVRNYDFRGPDLFVVTGVPRRERKSWVVWQEGKGPDVVIELLSESTTAEDKGKKKLIHQNRMRVPEYFWFDPFSGELAGFGLRDGVYEPIQPDAQGRLISQQTNLALVRCEGSYLDMQAQWLRWATLEGMVLPTHQELAEQARQRAEEARQHAEQERQRAEQERQRAEEARQHAEQECQAKDEAQAKVARLAARLKEMGLNPDEI